MAHPFLPRASLDNLPKAKPPAPMLLLGLCKPRIEALDHARNWERLLLWQHKCSANQKELVSSELVALVSSYGASLSVPRSQKLKSRIPVHPTIFQMIICEFHLDI